MKKLVVIQWALLLFYVRSDEFYKRVYLKDASASSKFTSTYYSHEGHWQSD